MTTTAVRGPHDLPALCDALAREKFFGEVRLIFRNGRLDRMVTEQSQQITPQERTPNAYDNRK
jgi:hypothetical protein